MENNQNISFELVISQDSKLHSELTNIDKEGVLIKFFPPRKSITGLEIIPVILEYVAPLTLGVTASIIYNEFTNKNVTLRKGKKTANADNVNEITAFINALINESQSDLSPLNIIEESHLSAIKANYHNAGEFLTDTQLIDFLKTINEENQADFFNHYIERLKPWAPSRFELIELIPGNYTAFLNVMKAIEMSDDTAHFNRYNFDFKVTINPTQTIDAYVLMKNEKGSTFVKNNKELFIVWLNVGIVNLANGLIGHFILNTMKDTDTNFFMVLERLIKSDNPKEIIFNLNNSSRSSFGNLLVSLLNDPEYYNMSLAYNLNEFNIDNESTISETISILKDALLTFIVGHECGHILHGHTGYFPYSNFLSGMSFYSENLKKEVQADLWGLTSMWDGCTNSDKSYVSIDFSFFIPVFFLTYMSATSNLLIRDQCSNDVKERLKYASVDYIERVKYVSIAIITTMKKQNFEKFRIDRLISGLPVLIWVLYEWIHVEYYNAIGEPYEPCDKLYVAMKNFYADL